MASKIMVCGRAEAARRRAAWAGREYARYERSEACEAVGAGMRGYSEPGPVVETYDWRHVGGCREIAA